MRKWNTLLSICIIILFLIHAVAGGFQLMGLLPGGNGILSVLAKILLLLITIHAVIGVKLTWDSMAACKKSGVSYYKENRLFWARRISGFAVMLFILIHVILFLGKNDGAYRLNYFGSFQLATQILMVLSLAIHMITNINPLMISFGVLKMKEYAVDILVVLSGILLFTGTGFVIYYIRWIIW